MIRVGDELTAALTERGISVVHDRELYDYPSYTGSYSRSLESVEAWLAEYPSIQLVIDLHRDAIENADGSYYRTIAQVPGGTCAQVLIIAGTGLFRAGAPGVAGKPEAGAPAPVRHGRAVSLPGEAAEYLAVPV